MNRLSRDQIRQQFKTASAQQSNLFTQALAALSVAISDLRAEGIDVELLLTGCATEQGFEIDLGSNVASWAQVSGGILRIGGSQHLVAFCTQVKLKSDGDDAEWKDCMIMAVSLMDIRLQGPRKEIRANIHHLHQDQNGLKDLQQFIITKAGTDCIIAQADTHQSFSHARQINLGLLNAAQLLPKMNLSKKTGNQT